jgi:hypothetical protein
VRELRFKLRRRQVISTWFETSGRGRGVGCTGGELEEELEEELEGLEEEELEEELEDGEETAKSVSMSEGGTAFSSIERGTTI